MIHSYTLKVKNKDWDKLKKSGKVWPKAKSKPLTTGINKPKDQGQNLLKMKNMKVWGKEQTLILSKILSKIGSINLKRVL